MFRIVAIRLIVALFTCLALPSAVFAQSVTVLLSPPPVVGAKTDENLSRNKIDFIYNTVEMGDFLKIDQYGLGYLHEWSGPKSAASFNLIGLLGSLEMDFGGTDSTGTTETIIAGGTYLLNVVNNDLDEGFGLAFFGSGQVMFMAAQYEMEMPNFAGNETKDAKSRAYFLSGLFGLVAEIPAGFYIQFIPYAYGTGMLFGSVTAEVDGQSMSVSMSNLPWSYTLGTDIVFRFSKQIPDWKVSLGTLFQQFQALTEETEDYSNLMFLASLRKDFRL